MIKKTLQVGEIIISYLENKEPISLYVSFLKQCAYLSQMMCKPEVTSSPSRWIDKPLMSPPSLLFCSQNSHLSILNPTLSTNVVEKMNKPAFPCSLTVRIGPPTQWACAEAQVWARKYQWRAESQDGLYVWRNRWVQQGLGEKRVEPLFVVSQPRG